MHGYEMCQEIERRTDSGKPRKVYSLTPKGQAAYDDATSSWRGLFEQLAVMLPEVAT